MKVRTRGRPVKGNSPTWRTLSTLRSFESEILTSLLLAGPLVWLVWRRGGVDDFDRAAVFGWIFLALGLLALFRTGRLTRVGWPLALLAVYPLLQLVPLGAYREYFLSDSQANVIEQVRAAGMEPFSALTLYPYATLQAALVLAGCCGLFILSRSLIATPDSQSASGSVPQLALASVSRSISRAETSFLIVAATLFALALLESASGLEQYLRAQVDDAFTFSGAHGTLVNKNHYSALLEGCFGVALGVLLAWATRAHRERPSHRWIGAMAALAAIAAAACLLGVVLSYSRAGIFVVLAMSIVAGAVAISISRRRSTAFVIAAVITATLASVLSMGGWRERFLQIVDAPATLVRLSIWQDTLRSVQEYWLTGAGLGTFPYAFQRSAMYLPQKTVDHAHNDYLQWLLELGVPGATLLIGALGFVFITTIRGIQRAPIQAVPSGPRRMYAIGALLGAGGILTHAWVDFPLQIPAIAALTAILLGCASALASPRSSPKPQAEARKATIEPQAGAWGQAQEAATVLQGAWGRGWGAARGGIWGSVRPYHRRTKSPHLLGAVPSLAYAFLAALLATGSFDHCNAEIYHAAGQQAFHKGDLAGAAHAWNRSLSANPWAAATWLKRAEMADAAGDRERAVRYSEIAKQIEPLTLRVEWPLAHYRLEAGAEDEAALGLATIAAGLPSLRPAVLEAAWASGLDAAAIADLAQHCDQNSFAAYLAFLVRREDWGAIVPAAEALSAECAPFVSAQTLWPTIDRLFEADQGAVLTGLRRIVGAEMEQSEGAEMEEQSEPLAALPPYRIAGSTASKGSTLAVPPTPKRLANGFGWIARPAAGVTVSDSTDNTGQGFLSVKFQQPRNIHYRHLTRLFSVKPGLSYSMHAEIRTERLRGSEGIRVMVSSPKRFITSSQPISKTTHWRPLTLRFVTEPGEQIIRVVIVRNRSQRLDNLITGHFFLRNVKLREQPADQRFRPGNEQRARRIQTEPDSTS